MNLGTPQEMLDDERDYNESLKMNKQFKGTKGTWIKKHVYTTKGSYYKVTGDISVCNITSRNEDVSEANANLIAKAPDLLKALSQTNIDLIELNKTNYGDSVRRDIIQKRIESNNRIIMKVYE